RHRWNLLRDTRRPGSDIATKRDGADRVWRVRPRPVVGRWSTIRMIREPDAELVRLTVAERERGQHAPHTRAAVTLRDPGQLLREIVDAEERPAGPLRVVHR